MSESTVQQQLVYWFRVQYPDKIIYANTNSAWFGGMRGKRAIIYGALRKREGLLAGVSDLFIPEPQIKEVYVSQVGFNVIESFLAGLYLELKDVGKTEKDLTDSQLWFLKEMCKRGYAAHWAAGFDQGKEIITEYMQGAI